MPGFSKCPCLRPQDEEVLVLDYRHCSLDFLPSDVFTYERTLEELNVDANQIRDLPRELFYCHGLRKLCLSDNEIISIPPAIASLINLQYLDISKNGIIDLPENIKQCKSLAVIEASVNPLGKLPEGFTQLLNLTELYLNDTFLDYMPGTFGRLTKLKILEVRENHLKTLPKSFSRLTQLERLDIGNNEFSEIPEVLGTLGTLLELWCDTNQIGVLPACLGQLKQLMFLDASKNRLESIPPELEGCVSLADLHVSTNLIRHLPESIGRLSNLTTFKADDNRLVALPFSIGGLVSLSELNISTNEIEEIPPSIGLLRHLRTMYADENYLMEVPPELGSCSGLTVLSLRSNSLTYIPDELGRIPRLRVLNLSDNKLQFLPYSLTRLKQIQALWLAENQTKPLVRLQSDVDPDTGQRVLTCYLLPQQTKEDREDMASDTNSFHPSMWEEERQQRQQIKFDFGELDERELGRLERTPTPYPKEMKHRVQHMRNLALKELNVPNGEVKGRSPNQPRVEGRGSPHRTSHKSVYCGSSEELRLEGGLGAGQTGLLRGSSGASLVSERHLLLRADKEKTLKDKARIKQHRSSQEDSEWENKSTRSTESLSKGKDKSRRKSSSKSRLSREEIPDADGFSSQQTVSMHRSQTFPTQHSSNTTSAAQFPSDQRISHKPRSTHTSEQSMAITNDASTYPAMIPQTYTDFRRDLQNRSTQLPAASSDTNQGSSRRPNSYHPQHNHQPHYSHQRQFGQRSKGYESDAGYRSEGVQSEILHSKKHRTLPPAVRDGYTSDWETVAKHRQNGRGSLGYTSDYERYVARHSRPKGHRNDVIGQQQVYNNYTHSTHQSHNQPHSQTIIPPSAHVPNTTKRTTLRNDELYEPNKNNKGKSKTSTTNPKDTTWKSNDGSKKGSTPSKGGQVSVSGSQGATPTRVGQSIGVSHREHERQGEAVAAATAEGLHPEESADDDAWRAQLYQASVKLQKSPSDPNKQFHKRLPSPTKSQPPAHPTPSHSTEHSISSTTYRSTPPYPEARSTPPYPEAPPYSSPTPKEPPPTSQQQQSPPPSTYTPGAVNSTPQPNRTQTQMEISQSVESLYNQQQQQRPPQSDLDVRYLTAASSPGELLRTPDTKGTNPRLAQLTQSPHNSKYPPYVSSPGSGQVSNYEKDVAVFKGNEPVLSQVSGSTDSGYVHGLSGEFKLGGSPHKHTTEYTSRVAALQLNTPKPASRMEVTIEKKPGLGFSIAGGIGSPGNPYRPSDVGIFITKVQADGPAAMTLQPGDKILQVNGVNFEQIEHREAVTTLRKTGDVVHMVTERC